MTIGAHRLLGAIIANTPADQVQTRGRGEGGHRWAIFEEYDLRISWSMFHNRVTVYRRSTGKSMWHGNDKHADVDTLQASLLDSLLRDLRREPAEPAGTAEFIPLRSPSTPNAQRSLLYISNDGAQVFQ